MIIYNCYIWYINYAMKWDQIKIDNKSLINILSTCWEHDLFPFDFICISEFYSWITCWVTQNCC
jgi:hypothetical protein